MDDRFGANPFRVLDLSAGAGVEEIDRAAARLSASLAIGRVPGHLDAIDLLPALRPDREAVERAARTLRDPLSRFACEVAWIWGSWDRTLEALRGLAGEGGPARLEAWAGETSPADVHDAAVALEVAARRGLERALAGEPPAPDEALPRPVAACADVAWRLFLASPGGRERLLERARSLGDPRLDERFVEETALGALEAFRDDVARRLLSAYRRHGALALDRIDGWASGLDACPELSARAGATLATELDPAIQRALERTIPAVNELGAGGGGRDVFARTRRWVEIHDDFLIHGLRPFRTRRLLAEKSGLGGAPWLEPIAEVVRVLEEILAFLGQGRSRYEFRDAVVLAAGVLPRISS